MRAEEVGCMFIVVGRWMVVLSALMRLGFMMRPMGALYSTAYGPQWTRLNHINDSLLICCMFDS